MSLGYDYSGKVALVTGASTGLGAEIALQFAKYGAQLTLTGLLENDLDEVSAKIGEITGGARLPLTFHGDLASDRSLPEMLIRETVAKYGRLDFLINNAGRGMPNDSVLNDKLLADVYEQLMGLHVRAPLTLMQLAVPHLEKSKGAIVSTSSIASKQAGMVVYAASKAALDMVTQSVALELAPKGIRVNTINPGPMATGFAQTVGYAPPTTPEAIAYAQEWARTMCPIGRIAAPADLANLVMFLCSDQATNITGTNILSDGGRALKAGDPGTGPKK